MPSESVFDPPVQELSGGERVDAVVVEALLVIVVLLDFVALSKLEVTGTAAL